MGLIETKAWLHSSIPPTFRSWARGIPARDRSTREISQFSGFCVAAVRRVRQQFRERRALAPRTHLCGRKTLLTEERKQQLQHLLSEQPDATLAELGARMDRSFRTSTIDLWLRRLGWKFKKISGRPRTRAARRRRKKGALA